MVNRTVRILPVVALFVFLSPATACAQMYPWRTFGEGLLPTTNAICGVGEAVVAQQPAALRMYVELSGKGKTLEEALAKLKDRREAALVQLQTLGAKKESVWVGTPTLSNVQSAQKSRMEQMIRQRLLGRGRNVPKGLEVPQSVAASALLTAEWPLPAADPEKLLLASEALRKKIKDADLAGAKDAEKPSPEEQEMAEEMAEMMGSSGEEQVRFGEPYFVYVGRFSPQDRDKAMAEAFQKAKAQASRLAQAAGVRLGPLLGLSGDSSGNARYYDEGIYDTYDGSSQRGYAESLVRRHAAFHRSQGEGEVTGSELGSLGFVAYVRAMFAIEKQ
jgi:hypothetical protein